MLKLRQSMVIAAYNFRLWRKNPRIFVTFLLTFILCFLLSDKIIRFALAHNTSVQLVETFVWCFGDSGAILLSNVLLVALFADMPFISSGTPFYLIRTSRHVWVWGQIIYIMLATALYLLFILGSTAVLSIHQAFSANMWSPTAAILGYTSAGQRIAVPALVKTLEMSWPYQSMLNIFLLMLGYSLVMVQVMLVSNLRYGQAVGVIAVFTYNLYGLLLNPDTIQAIFDLPDEAYYIANVIIGWISPLNHATYHMHNFGYDKLPKLWQSYLIFLVLIVVGFFTSVRSIKSYSFTFTGTEW